LVLNRIFDKYPFCPKAKRSYSEAVVLLIPTQEEPHTLPNSGTQYLSFSASQAPIGTDCKSALSGFESYIRQISLLS
ncbi:hypothetical protein KIH23_12550, partial [Flavobacterium sp. CYK-55]|uniref:hypothetical protein n=1 Tax=Flavobacterium sp. CYK-55 TaxID=2835529 RepID=UPI001BD0EB81